MFKDQTHPRCASGGELLWERLFWEKRQHESADLEFLHPGEGEGEREKEGKIDRYRDETRREINKMFWIFRNLGKTRA